MHYQYTFIESGFACMGVTSHTICIEQVHNYTGNGVSVVAYL